MAQVKRTNMQARGGGKLALFEVIQAAQTQGDTHLTDAVAPLVQVTGREAPAAPATSQPWLVVATPPPNGPQRQIVVVGDPPQPRRPHRRSGGSTLLGFAVGAAAVVTLVSAGFFMMQRFSRNPPHEIAGTQPMPEVLDVEPRAAREPAVILANPNQQQQSELRVPSGAPAVIPPNFRRTSGMNYVLVQSYAASEEAQAIATRDALLAAGIRATIERDIPGWNKRLSVVGTDGFEQMKNNPQYQDYLRKLDRVSKQLTASDRRIRKFEPTPFQWGR